MNTPNEKLAKKLTGQFIKKKKWKQLINTQNIFKWLVTKRNANLNKISFHINKLAKKKKGKEKKIIPSVDEATEISQTLKMY